MKICDNCGMPIPQSATRCPFCRNKRQDSFSRFTTKVIRKVANIVAGIVLVGMVIVGIVNTLIESESASENQVYNENQEYKTSHEELFKSLDAKMKSPKEDVKRKNAISTSTTGGKVDKEINTSSSSLQTIPRQMEKDLQSYTEEETNIENEYDEETQKEPETVSKEIGTNEERKQQRALRRAMKKQLKEMKKNNRN